MPAGSSISLSLSVAVTGSSQQVCKMFYFRECNSSRWHNTDQTTQTENPGQNNIKSDCHRWLEWHTNRNMNICEQPKGMDHPKITYLSLLNVLNTSKTCIQNTKSKMFSRMCKLLLSITKKTPSKSVKLKNGQKSTMKVVHMTHELYFESSDATWY